MVIEIADIRIPLEKRKEFERVICAAARDVLAKADGFLSYEIGHSIESPDRYILRVGWETKEHHTLGFRQSNEYKEWQRLVVPFFKVRPIVEHFEILDLG